MHTVQVILFLNSDRLDYLVEMFFQMGDTYAKHLSRADERYDLVFFWLEKCVAVSLALLFPARQKRAASSAHPNGGRAHERGECERDPAGNAHVDSASAGAELDAAAGLTFRPKEGVSVLTQCAIFNALALLALSRFHLLAYKLNEVRFGRCLCALRSNDLMLKYVYPAASTLSTHFGSLLESRSAHN